MQWYRFAYICLYYVYIPYILCVYKIILIIFIFISEILKSFSELITLFCKRILIFNILITKTAIQNYFIFFIRFIYTFSYITIHAPKFFILNVRVFPFNKERSDRVFENVFEIISEKTNYCFSWAFFIT